MHITRATFAILLFSGALNTHAAANIAKIPVGIRQTYNDGSATELMCKSDSPCTFTVYGKRAQTLSLQRDYVGYSISGVNTDYLYWPNSGHDLVLSLGVSCKDIDLALVDDPDPECRMFLERQDSGFRADRIEVFPRDGRPGYRDLGSAP